MAIKITYTESAAGASVDALLEQIKNDAEIQSIQSQLQGTINKTSISAADMSATYTQKALEDQASGERASAIASIAGSATSLVATFGMLGASMYADRQATQLEKSQAPEVGIEGSLVEETSTTTAAAENETAELTVKQQARLGAPGSTHEMQSPVGEAEVSSKQADVKTATTTAENAQEEQTVDKGADDALTEQVKALRGRSVNLQNAASFINNNVSTLGSSIGQLIDASYKDQQAKDQGIATLEQAMGQVFGNFYGSATGASNASETDKQGAASVWAAIIQASTSGVRG